MFTPFQRKWFGRGIDMPLEVAETQQQYRVPDDYDTYLRAEYGDGYLTPPPADEQQPKHAVYFMDLDTPCHKYMTNGRFDPRKAGMSY